MKIVMSFVDSHPDDGNDETDKDTTIVSATVPSGGSGLLMTDPYTILASQGSPRIFRHGPRYRDSPSITGKRIL